MKKAIRRVERSGGHEYHHRHQPSLKGTVSFFLSISTALFHSLCFRTLKPTKKTNQL